MRDFSDDSDEGLSGVRPRDACSLLAIVHDARLRNRSFIAARYADSAINFEATLAFLEDVGWVHSDNGTIEPTTDLAAQIVTADAPQRHILFAEALLESAGRYQRILARYLTQFVRYNGELVFRPSVEAKLRDTVVRDFFMDLGAVSYRPDGDLYVLENPFTSCTVWARNVLSPTPAQIAQQVEQRMELGLRAELAVIAWERDRLGSRHQNRIRHIAREHPAACFDIQSVTITNNIAVPRFIEVKAVARGSFEFHWSRAEIEAADLLRERYFLYLVPVMGPDAFDLTHMEIVQNAYSEVYHNPSNWSTTVADIICRKRESHAS